MAQLIPAYVVGFVVVVVVVFNVKQKSVAPSLRCKQHRLQDVLLMCDSDSVPEFAEKTGMTRILTSLHE